MPAPEAGPVAGSGLGPVENRTGLNPKPGPGLAGPGPRPGSGPKVLLFFLLPLVL